MHNDIYRDESILHSIEPSLITLAELHTEQQKEQSDNIPARKSHSKQDRHLKLDAQAISQMWGIGINRARATLKCTTQRGIRSAILPLSKRYRADRMYNLKQLNSKFATDTFFSDHKSLNQNTCAQIYSHKNGFLAVYPMEKANGNTLGQSLIDFCHDFSVPSHLTFDGATAQVGKNTLFMKTLRKYQSDYHISGPRRPNENPSEAGIRALKLLWYRIMHKKKVPKNCGTLVS
jgi:hypothetical protein